jgi:hypothetical protein
MTALLVVTILVPEEADEVVLARVFASSSGPAVLWEDTVKIYPGGAPPWARLVLGQGRPLPSSVGAQPVRFVSVRPASDRPWTPRVPIDTLPLRLDRRVRRLESVVSDLDGSRAPTQALLALRDAIDEHEVRLARLERSKRLVRVSDLARSLAQRLDRLDQDDGRVVRLEDELEDLVGPHGDVVDLEDRLSELERAVCHRLRETARGSGETKELPGE